MSVTKKHLLEIDLIKGIAIISVILTHCLPYNDNFMVLRMLTTSMALPIFILLLGRNMAASFEKHHYLNSDSLNLVSYFKNRIKRFLIPFIPIFFLSLILGLVFYHEVYFGAKTFVGYLPLPGPGDYFITVLLQFIIIFPLLYSLYRRSPRFTLIGTFALSFIFELISAKLSILNANSYLYYANILRYLFLITLGLWVIEGFEPHKRFRSRQESLIVLMGLVVSTVYLLAFSFFHWQFPYFNNFWGTEYPTLGSYLFIMAFYPLAIYMLEFKFLPSSSNNRVVKFIQYLGKASYHVFLIQILFFAVLYNPYGFILRHGLLGPITGGIAAVLISLIVTIPVGLLFYKYEYIFENMVNRLIEIIKNLFKSNNSSG